ncbi:MAG: FecR domain-containing protein [Planctomycetota bacterium]
MSPSSSIPPEIPREVEDALGCFFDNEATPGVCETIHNWLEEDPNHAAIFAEYGTIERMIYEAQKTEDASAVFALLQEAEENAEPITVTMLDTSGWKGPGPDSKQWHDAFSYLYEHTITSRVIRVAATAAVLVLLATLAIVFMPGAEESPDIADVPDFAPVAPTPDPNRVVATITQQHGAVWVTANGEGTLPERTMVGPNQPLKLLEGYAEITTRRGAIAILEAPCVIEFTEDDNGFHLLHGKVACLVEGERAKGFKVLTEQLEITDFGTTFGVDASSPSAVQVHVYEGEVQVARSTPDDDGHVISERLFGGDAIVDVSGRDAFVKIDADPAQFLATSTTVIKLPGTGFGLSEREVERGWAVVAIDGRELAEPIYWVVSDHAGATGVPHDPGTAQWIARPITPVLPQGQSSQSYLIRTEVDLPPDLDPERARIAMRFSADNELRSIRVNGHRVAVPPVNAGPNIDFHLTDMVIDRHLTQGTNIFEFEVINRAFGNVSAGDVSMYVAWDLYIEPQWPSLEHNAGG